MFWIVLGCAFAAVLGFLGGIGLMIALDRAFRTGW